MRTLMDARILHVRKDKHWFDHEAMKFWGTSICSELMADKYFITSDYFSVLTKNKGFTIREIDWETGSIRSIGKIGQYLTYEDVEKAIRELICPMN